MRRPITALVLVLAILEARGQQGFPNPGTELRSSIDFLTTDAGLLSLDIYRTRGDALPAPLVLVVGGPIGDRDQRPRTAPECAAIDRALASIGLAALVPDYRERFAASDICASLERIRGGGVADGIDGSKVGLLGAKDGVPAALVLAHEKRIALKGLVVAGCPGIVMEELRADLPMLVVCCDGDPETTLHAERELAHQAILAGAPVTVIREGNRAAASPLAATWLRDRLAGIPALPEDVSQATRAFEVARAASESADESLSMRWLERALALGFEDFQILLLDHGFAKVRALPAFRRFLRDHTRGASVRLCNDTEPGRPITLRGRVVRSDGETPVAGALLQLWHTDWTGVYASFGEEDRARIFGFVRTGQRGEFTVRSIEPRGYPKTLIPAHVHVTVSTEDESEHNFEILFSDDPRLTPPARQRAAALGWPIAELRSDGGWVADVLIRLPGKVTGQDEGLPKSPAPTASAARPEAPRRRTVAFVLHDGVELIELTGPGQIFASAPGLDAVTVGESKEPIRSYFLTIVPQYTDEDCPPPDIIVFPGPARALRSGRLRSWLQSAGARAEYVMSVCNGALVLAHAGLLDGLEATSADGHLDELWILGKDIKPVVNRRFQHSGRIVTAKSYFAGVDAALHIVSLVCGEETARQVATRNLYEWRPEELARLHAEPPVAPVSSRYLVYRAILEGGPEAGVARYRQLEEDVASGRAPANLTVPRREMFGWLAGTLRDSGRTQEAVKLCTFETTMWPDSSDARLDLAEAHLADGAPDRALRMLLQEFEAGSPRRRALDLFRRVLRDARTTIGDETRRAHRFLRAHPEDRKAVLIPPDEPGTPLVVTGTVQDDEGMAVPGALLYVFHTDAEGRYTKDQAMAEPDARLCTYLRAGPDGRFEFRSIRPGGYVPLPGETDVRAMIPSHIHFEVEAPGFTSRRFQMVFADDPRLTPDHWRTWAANGCHPIVAVAPDPAGVHRCSLDIVLGRP